MSNFSRGSPQGDPKEGEKGDASSDASEKQDAAEPAQAPAVVVSRVVNVSWERRAPSTQTQKVQPPPQPAPPARAAPQRQGAPQPQLPSQKITAPMMAPVAQQPVPPPNASAKPAAKAPTKQTPAKPEPAKEPAKPEPARQAAPPPPPDDEPEPPTDPNWQAHAPHSTRPSFADRAMLFEPGTSPSIEATFDKLLNDVDASFDQMVASVRGSRPPPSGNAGKESDYADVKELFGQLAAKHMRPVRDFMIDLRWGEAPQTWIAVSEPAVKSLRGAAERLQLGDLVEALDGYARALEAAAIVKLPTVTGDARDMLVAAYAKLAEAMPQAFGLEVDQSQRESVIVHSLLLQVPGVRKVTIDKLYAAGLSSLEPIFAAKSDDIVATTGIDAKLAQRIVERFQHYRRELKTVVPDATHTQERDRLTQLAKRLRHQHDEYEKAAASWEKDAAQRKKAMREARAATLLEVNVVLARLGEVERLKNFERLPFERKVEELEAFLAEADKSF